MRTTSEADVVFVVDSSASINSADQNNYNLMIGFIVKVCGQFNISRDGVRVGLVNFSTDSIIEFRLEDFDSKPEVFDAIRSIKYQDEKTSTWQGLQDLRQVMKSARTDVPRIAIVITDGR